MNCHRLSPCAASIIITIFLLAQQVAIAQVPIFSSDSAVGEEAYHKLVPNFLAVYTISVGVSPLIAGSVTGGGNFGERATVTVTAEPTSGYIFLNWTEGTAIVSTSAQYEFAATRDRTLIANFAPGSYSISVTAQPSDGGVVAGGGVFRTRAIFGSIISPIVSVTASAAPGYSFTNWVENGNILSTSSNYIFTATDDRELVANFVRFYQISVIGAGEGEVAGGGVFTAGSSVSVSFSPRKGTRFINWMEGGKEVSRSALYEFIASADRLLSAHVRLGLGGGMPFLTKQVHESSGSFLKVTLTPAALSAGVVWRRKGSGAPFSSTSDRKRLPYGAHAIEYGVGRGVNDLASYYQDAVDLPPEQELELTIDYSYDKPFPLLDFRIADVWFPQDGSITCLIIGPPSIKFRFDSSADLRSWSPVEGSEHALDLEGQTEFSFPAETRSPKQFFRALVIQ